MSGEEIGSFDDIQDIEWVSWKSGEVLVKFESSEFIVGLNSFNKTSYTFSVSEDKIDKLMGVTSKRLMLKLKAYHPLAGKTFMIKRIGASMDTDYDVTEVV